MILPPKRHKLHPYNPKLRFFYERHYETFPVQQLASGPLIENYLKIALRTLRRACRHQRQTLVFRLDLRFPQAMPSWPMHADNKCISRFFYALNKELEAAGTKYPAALRYLWCREQNISGKPHYHLLLLLNGDAFRYLGDFDPTPEGGYQGNNLYHRCVRAWSWAIGWPLTHMKGRVHVAKDKVTKKPCVYYLHRDDRVTFEKVFYAASYLCKSYSKPIGQGIRCFDSSHL